MQFLPLLLKTHISSVSENISRTKWLKKEKRLLKFCLRILWVIYFRSDMLSFVKKGQNGCTLLCILLKTLEDSKML
jgi:hypothetical protein